MATYSPQDLLNRWKREELTVEQAIGQLLQHLVALEKELNDVKRRLNKLSANRED